jgi:hypothetical protein
MGKTILNVVPFFGALCTSMLAFQRCIVACTVAKPIPVPMSILVVKKGSKMRRCVSSFIPTPVSVIVSWTPPFLVEKLEG